MKLTIPFVISIKQTKSYLKDAKSTRKICTCPRNRKTLGILFRKFLIVKAKMRKLSRRLNTSVNFHVAIYFLNLLLNTWMIYNFFAPGLSTGSFVFGVGYWTQLALLNDKRCMTIDYVAYNFITLLSKCMTNEKKKILPVILSRGKKLTST